MLNLPIVSVLADFEAGGPPNALTSKAIGLDSGNGRGVPRWSCGRGRSYELAQPQSGTASITVDDPQETLNPANTSSPLNTAPAKLALYRTVGIRAFWPRQGNSLLAGTYGGGFHPGFEGGTVNGWAAVGGGTVTNVTTTPRSGARCLRLAVDGPSGTARAFVDAGSGQHIGPCTVPGLTACYSAWVRANAPGMTISFTFGGVTSASTSSTSWTRLSVTVLATLSRTPLTLNVSGGPAGAGAQVVFLDDEQLELGVDTPSDFTTTGPIRYPVWSGYIERYPQQWIDQGYRGVRPLECVDALSVLSRTIIRESYDTEVEAGNPSFYLPLDDASGPPRARGRLASTIRMSEYPAAKGGNITWGGDTFPDGTRTVALSQQPQDPADVPYAEQFTSLDTWPQAGRGPNLFTINTMGATFEFWVKVTASRMRVSLQGITQGNYNIPDFVVDTTFGIQNFADGRTFLVFRENGNLAQAPADSEFVFASAHLDDGRWHYCALVLSPDPAAPTTYQMRMHFDGGHTTVGGNTHRLLGINSVHVETETRTPEPLAKGAAGRLAFYSYALSADQLLAHYRRGSGFAGETAHDRATRILERWWGGPFTVDPSSGLTLPPDFGYAGGSALAALESITSADEGTVWATRTGAPRVESSLSRYDPAKATGWVFGEDAAGGEFPYESVAFDYDPNYVYSHISVTRPGRNGPIELVDPVIEAEIGQRVYSRSIDVDTDYELMQAALYLQGRYGQARMRVQRMTLRPDANPALWPVVLTLDPSLRVTIRRRTSQGAVIDQDYYVEAVSHDADHEASAWSTTVDFSPVFVDQGWVLGDPVLGVLGSTTVPVY